MGSCFSGQTTPKRVELRGAHLLGQDNGKQNNLTDSEQQYQELHQEPSVTNNNDKLLQLHHHHNHHHNHQQHNHHSHDPKYNDLQRQIDILKQCSDAEIKMLKSRIQSLEKRLPCNSREEVQLNSCSKGTPLKECPHIIHIIKISKLYNTLIQQNPSKVRNNNNIVYILNI